LDLLIKIKHSLGLKKKLISHIVAVSSIGGQTVSLKVETDTSRMTFKNIE